MSDEELIARLRTGEDLHLLAADRIEALVKRLDAVKDKAEDHIIDLMAENAALVKERDKYRDAVGILEDALQEAGDDYPGSSMQQWCRQQVRSARAALQGADHE